MQFWNTILHTALLGTDKKQLEPAALAPVLAAIAGTVAQQTLPKEEQFLDVAAIAFNYRQAGVAALKKEGIAIVKAPAEETPYCSAIALQELKNVLAEESLPLLKFWLQLCQRNKQLIKPELLPVVLQTGATQKTLQPYITSCGGQRAIWLGHFNKDWKFSSGTGNEEIWQTGTPEQRKQLLLQLRKEEPAKALEWIQQAWAQEDAATKIDFLKTMVIGIAENDISFLERLSTEKSKKVKDEAVALLKKIPSSSIVRQYRDIISQAMQVKKERGLLGFGNKISLTVLPLPFIDESIFKTGIEKLSSNKEFSEEEFIVYQLMQYVPPSFYEEQWQLSPEEIIRHLEKDGFTNKLLRALVLSVINFSDERWANLLAQHCSVFYADIMPLLPPQQQELYSNKYFAEQPESIIHYATKREQEWGPELALSIFKQAAKNPYQYNRAFFNQNIHLVPVSIISGIEKITGEGNLEYAWSSISGYVLKLLSLKKQIREAFNA